MDRCQFANTEEMIAYHDHEWGKIKSSSNEVFEALCLESLQAGLSWAIILAKRRALQAAFAQFDMVNLSKFEDSEVDQLMENEQIIRHRLKIQAMINNAQAALTIEEDDSLPNFRDYTYQLANSLLTEFDGEEAQVNQQMTKVLKKRGFKFVGPTTIESFLEAIGVYNHHEETCFLYADPQINS